MTSQLEKSISITADVVLFRKSSINPLKQVLLIQRKNPPFQHYWALPGGFIEVEETCLSAATRELYEETNIEMSPDDFYQLGFYDTPNRDERGRIITTVFMGEYAGNKTPMSGDDATSAMWIWLDTLDLPDKPSTVTANKKRLAFDHAQIINDALLEMELL